MWAILVDAIRSYRRTSNSFATARRKEFLETQAWIFESDPDAPFSIEIVCAVLGLDAGHLRRLVRTDRRTIPESPMRLREESPRRKGKTSEYHPNRMRIAAYSYRPGAPRPE